MFRKVTCMPAIMAASSCARRWVSSSPIESAVSTRSLNDQSILLSHLKKISSQQKEFLFGSSEKNNSSESLFDSINNAYAESMKNIQRSEVDLYIEKQREYYIQRLDEEVTEFISEQSEILKEFELHELDYFQNELSNDSKEFSDQRQKECRIRLEDDVRKYQFSLIPSRKEKNDDAGSEKEGPCESPVECDTLISAYVNRRHNFYEQILNNEIVEYVRKRKIFYEELLQTRLSRKAETVKLSVEEFQAKREAYYKSKLHRDAEWISNSFQGHYEKCFLQCFARYAWLHYRKRNMKNKKMIPREDTSISQLVREIPLSTVLDEYEKETMGDIGRDLFLKAAYRLANTK